MPWQSAEATVKLPPGFRIVSPQGVDISGDSVDNTKELTMATIGEEEGSALVACDSGGVPWSLYNTSMKGTFKAVEIVFWTQHALKHVNPIVLKLRSCPVLAVKAGMASSSQVERNVRAILNPPDHNDIYAELKTDMSKKDRGGKTWQAVCRILFFKRALLEDTQ
jgi:hypothetical protein